MEADSLHRLMKSLVDSGSAESFEHAMEIFSNYGVRLIIAKDAKDCTGSQIAALTAINVAARSFQGNVCVDADDDFLLSPRGFGGQTLSDFVRYMGINEANQQEARDWPTIVIGAAMQDDAHVVRPWANGWQFGIGTQAYSHTIFEPACVAAGALAVSEAFSILRRDNPYAGHRPITLSLWPAGPTTPPISQRIESSCWIVGLGHLGQAYAWTLGFMEHQSNATLYLQDMDFVTESSISTSVLSRQSDLGKRKTRVVSTWLEERGYQTALVERRFDAQQRVGMLEPTTALFGVDNPAARRVVEGAGFRLVVDAGLGSGFNDFRAIRVRTFPGPSKAEALWATDYSTQGTPNASAYRKLLSEGIDPCGVTTLASRAVGAPFVGCVAAAYVISEWLRRTTSGPTIDWIDISLRDPERYTCSTAE